MIYIRHSELGWCRNEFMKMRSNPLLFIHGHKFKIAIDFGDFLVDFLGGLVSEAIGKRLILPKNPKAFVV